MPTNMNVLMLSSVINQRYTRLHGTADTMLTLWHVGVSCLLLVVVVCVCPLLASCILSPSIPHPAGYPNLYPVPLYRPCPGPTGGRLRRTASGGRLWRTASPGGCLRHTASPGGRLRRTHCLSVGAFGALHATPAPAGAFSAVRIDSSNDH